MAVTPMMQQYLELKEKYKDTLIFFQLGDFYEMFNEDAQIGAKELGLTLTHRQNSPMCGVPQQAGDAYVQKLVKKGYKVAIVDQIGDPKIQGLTERKVTRVVTPGTILTDDTLSDVNNNYIVLVAEENNELVLTGADISTGECFYGLYDNENNEQIIFDEIYRLMPAEILIVRSLSFQKKFNNFVQQRLNDTTITKIEIIKKNVSGILSEHFDEKNLPASDFAAESVAILLDYIHKTVMTDLKHISKLTRLDISDHLILDPTAMKNLEITRNLKDGSKQNTLFEVLDFTKTAMGTRLLRNWLESPLIEITAINRRLDAVEELVVHENVLEKVRECLREIHDFERLIMKVEINRANAADLVALKNSLRILPSLIEALSEVKTYILLACRDGLGSYDEIVSLIERAIIDNPGNIVEGGIIKNGYDEKLDEYRLILNDSKMIQQQIEEKERNATGIRSLKIGYNKVFGFYIEVRHANADKVPANYIRKQTLANAERYITEELKEFETKFLNAQFNIIETERRLFVEICEHIKKYLAQIQDTARRVGLIDTIASLAKAANTHTYKRPEMRTNGEIVITNGRHPLVERIVGDNMFVPNDTNLNHKNCEIMIITGPNMAGKSTYMRQTALLTLMAQIGSFIPALSASITPVDRIFTRIGASDDLISGQSTFMVEMNEVAQILKYATKNSLIILDEVGRGTSTFDGMSIARAVIEYIAKKIQAKTLFATHYHELTDLAEKDKLKKIKNYCVAVKELDEEITFLRRIKPGGADKSYGIQVAKLAGLPKVVMRRAETILKELETGNKKSADNTKSAKENSLSNADTSMPSLFATQFAEQLANLDVTTLTPIEAMNILFKLQKQAREATGMN